MNDPFTELNDEVSWLKLSLADAEVAVAARVERGTTRSTTVVVAVIAAVPSTAELFSRCVKDALRELVFRPDAPASVGLGAPVKTCRNPWKSALIASS